MLIFEGVVGCSVLSGVLDAFLQKKPVAGVEYGGCEHTKRWRSTSAFREGEEMSEMGLLGSLWREPEMNLHYPPVNQCLGRTQIHIVFSQTGSQARKATMMVNLKKVQPWSVMWLSLEVFGWANLWILVCDGVCV